jgi:hypothetical protein
MIAQRVLSDVLTGFVPLFAQQAGYKHALTHLENGLMLLNFSGYRFRLAFQKRFVQHGSTYTAGPECLQLCKHCHAATPNSV